MTTRVYTGTRGKVAHLLPDNNCFGRVVVVHCGLWAWYRDAWFGTGSQDEYERAAELPTCKNCERKAANP